MLINTALALVRDNRLTASQFGIVVSGGQGMRIATNSFDRGGVGIVVGNVSGPAIVGNRLSGLSSFSIAVISVLQRCEIIENRLVRCGSGSQVAIGIGVLLVWGELHIEANEVMDIGLPAIAGDPASTTAYGISVDLILEARVQSNLVTYSDVAQRPVTAEDRALRMRGLLEMSFQFAAGVQVVGFGVQIVDNKFIGVGASALVELLSQPINDNLLIRFERVQFSGNYCAHASGAVVDGSQVATVSLVCRRCTISGNQVKAGTPGFPSYHFHGMPGPFLGNISHGPNLGRLPANEFPAPEAAFNMLA